MTTRREATNIESVVVTGLGLCCNMGSDLEGIAAQLRRGENIPFERYEPGIAFGSKCHLYGPYTGPLDDDALELPRKLGRFMGKASRLALSASRRALAMSGVSTDRLAVVVGSGTGDVQTHLEMKDKLDSTRSAKRVGPATIPKIMASTISANLVNVLETTGPSMSAAAACAGGAYNIIVASQMIQLGLIDAALVGGVEVVDEHFYAGFDAMRAFNGDDNDTPERASRPYAADRKGFVFGEGAGTLVIESEATARARGASPLARLVGYGMSSDGDGQMVAPNTSGPCRAMQQAIELSGSDPTRIDYVNTHGTSTPLGDVSEVVALKQAFGTHRPMYSSTKGYTGHTISAAGAIEAIFSILMLRGGWVAPSVNASPLDPALADYPPVTEATDVALDRVLSCSFGFGGTNAALVFESP